MHNNLPRFFTFIKTFDKHLIKELNNNIGIIYRNYSTDYDKRLIAKISNFCKKNNKKFYLSNNMILAKNLGLDGVYIPSFNNLLNTSCSNHKKNFHKIGSAHSIEEIKTKEKQGVKLLFVSPLFKKTVKNNFLDCVKFNNFPFCVINLFTSAPAHLNIAWSSSPAMKESSVLFQILFAISHCIKDKSCASSINTTSNLGDLSDLVK